MRHICPRSRSRCAKIMASSSVPVIKIAAIAIAIAIAAVGTASRTGITVAVADAFTLPSPIDAKATRFTATVGGSSRRNHDFLRLHFTYQDSVEHDPTREEGEPSASAVSTVPVSFYSSDSSSKSKSGKGNNKNDTTNDNSSSSSSSPSSVSVSVERYNKMSVTELKRMLMDRNVDFRDCIEKRDLVERLLENYDNNEFHEDEEGDSVVVVDDDDHLDLYRSTTAQRPPRRGARRRKSRLMDSELALIETFKKVSPSVANIQTTVTTTVSNGLQLKPMEVPLGTGSGFLWDSDGHVVTNYHVVSAGRKAAGSQSQLPKTVKVKLSGMTQAVDADVVGVEPEKDLAVLKVRLSRSSLRKLPRPIELGSSNDLQVGQTVLAIGNPFGLDDTLTKGIVSALGRDVDGIGGRPIHNCIQVRFAVSCVSCACVCVSCVVCVCVCVCVFMNQIRLTN